MTPNSADDRVSAPTIAEVAALTRRLRALSAPGRGADTAERAVFLADKDALIARITHAAAGSARDRSRAGFARAQAVRAAMTDAVLTRAAGDGYVLVGPSARTWRRDPDTGRPTVAVSDAEHQAVRDLLGRYALDTAEPEWVTGPDGRDDVHSTVRIADTATETTYDSDREQEDDLRAPIDDAEDAAECEWAYGPQAGHWDTAVDAVDEPPWASRERWDRRMADPDTRAAIAAALDRLGSASAGEAAHSSGDRWDTDAGDLPDSAGRVGDRCDAAGSESVVVLDDGPGLP